MTEFISDNTSPAHPNILKALNDANNDYALSYGEDIYTKNAIDCFKEHFGKECKVFFTFTGTASNIIALKSTLSPGESVICAESAHLNRDECGAPEANLGVKLIPLTTEDGKLSIDSIKTVLKDNNNVHRPAPKMISISQCTEWGTVYTLEELKTLSDFCKENDLYLHIDGARFANAACFLNISLKEASLHGAIDLLSFGGTKNGLIGAEAVVIFNPKLAERTARIQKQTMQLSSKMRYVSAQFNALFQDQLWQKNASHANKMAMLLAEEIKDVVDIVQPVETNVIFAKLPPHKIAPLQEAFPFILWKPDESIVRWMTSFATHEKSIMSFAKKIKEIVYE